MRVCQLIRWSMCALLLSVAGASLPASPPPQTPQQPVAGKITTMIPTGSVLREKKTLEAKKDLQVLWQDTVKTDRGGRARLRLEDGSILNVGSQASLVVTKHDPGKQQTDLELIYGKVRADVTKIATPDGHFEIRTKVAVCGVVGTEEYLETTDLATTVIALGGGQVRVSSSDPQFPGTTLLNPGETVSVIAGRAPGPKRLATPNEMLKATDETESDTVATMEPGASVAGRSFDAVITGKNLGDTQSVSFAQPGITAKLRGSATATQIPVTITIGAEVPVGAYGLTINRTSGLAVAGFAVVTQSAIQSGQNPASTIQLPPSQDFNVTQGVKIPFDASGARTSAGTQIVAYQWTVPSTTVTGTGATFSVNTSLLAPGTYNVQLTVINDSGQVATQQYPLVVEAGVQPVEIVRDLASAYESLQPTSFLKNFDEERFRNYAGFAAAIEDSFRSKLETMRVFQRPVNCAVVQLQDDGVCQAEFQLQFTLKDQPSELLDAQGNPIPPGTTPPANARTGKRILTGSEQATIRFHRAEAGWKIVDYGAIVNCPSGGSSNGVNVGSCLLAIGSPTAPSFQIVNLHVSSTDLSVGGAITGSFAIAPTGGFTGSLNFTGQGQIGGQPVSVQFSPNPAPADPTKIVQFTVFGPATAPTGVSGPAPFTLIVTGTDTSGAITATANTPITLQPDFSLAVTPATTSGAPAPVTQNSTFPVTVSIAGGTGFNGSVFIDFPNLPAGFSATGGNIAPGAQGSFPLTISGAAVPGPALITIRGTSSFGAIRTATLFLNVTSDFTLNVTPPSSAANPIQASNLAPIQLNVQVVAAFGFAGTVAIDFPNLPTGLSATGGNVAAGATVTFSIQTSQFPVGPPTNVTITVRGRFGNDVQTILVFAQIAIAIPIQPGQALAQASVYAMDPPALKPGDAVIARLYGKNMNSVTSVEVSGTGIKAELLQALPTELHVRFTADAALDGGSRMITLRTNGNKAASMAIDVTRGSRLGRVPIVSPVKTGAESEKTDASAGARQAPDLVISAQDFTMTPAQPKTGDTVSFHLVVRNTGTAAVEDAAVEFSIGGTGVRQREKVSIAPGESESLEFEWKAGGAGRLEPRVIVDPESKLQQLTTSGKKTALQAFELAHQETAPVVSSKTGNSGEMRQRGDLRLALGGCAGFRLTSGAEQSCGGSADFEVSSRGGTSLVIEAEGVRSLGAMPLDQADGRASDGLSSSAALMAGNTYLLRTRHGLAVVRVTQIRGVESVRNAPPAALRGPQMGGADRAVHGNSGPQDLTLVLEWKTLQ